MKPSALLPLASLVSALLGAVHLTDDIVRGTDAMTQGGFVVSVLILLVWLCGGLLGAERRWGYVITLLGSIFGLVIVALHMRATGSVVSGKILTYNGAFRFIWTLLVLSVTSAFSLILSVRGLWSLRRASAR